MIASRHGRTNRLSHTSETACNHMMTVDKSVGREFTCEAWLRTVMAVMGVTLLQHSAPGEIIATPTNHCCNSNTMSSEAQLFASTVTAISITVGG